MRKGCRLAQVVGFFSALGLLWILVSSTSVQAFIYKAVVPEKSTFSIVAVDPLTGDVGIAGASCVPISAAGMTALVPGQGASATQAAAFDPKQRMQIFNMIQQGATATEIIDFVGDESYDASNGIRQYGVVTLNGGKIHVAGFTGNQTEEWSGDRQNLTMAVSTQGNTLEGPHVVSDALAAFTATDIGPVAFPDRLLRALEAASAAGGDRRCNGDGIQQTAQAAFIAVSRADQPPFAAIMGRDPSPDDPDTPWLFIRADGSVRDLFHLSPGRDIAIGRDKGDWPFPYDQSMSGAHAVVRSEDADFVVLDAGSRNGVALAARGDVALKKGSRILVGDKQLMVEMA